MIEQPLREIIEENVSEGLVPERHGASVLNAESPTDEANRFLVGIDCGDITVEGTDLQDFEVAEDLAGYSVMVKGVVAHKMGDEKEPGEFDGWYIGRESHGLPRPYLLLSPGRVYRKDARSSEVQD